MARADMDGDDLFALMSALGWLVGQPSFTPRAVTQAVDIYAKAGVARLHTILSGFYPVRDNICVLGGGPCGTAPFRSNQTTTTFAAGAGAQYKFGVWAVRAEYERFNADAEHPSLASLGLIWTF